MQLFLFEGVFFSNSIKIWDASIGGKKENNLIVKVNTALKKKVHFLMQVNYCQKGLDFYIEMMLMTGWKIHIGTNWG